MPRELAEAVIEAVRVVDAPAAKVPPEEDSESQLDELLAVQFIDGVPVFVSV